MEYKKYKKCYCGNKIKNNGIKHCCKECRIEYNKLIGFFTLYSGRDNLTEEQNKKIELLNKIDEFYKSQIKKNKIEKTKPGIKEYEIIIQILHTRSEKEKLNKKKLEKIIKGMEKIEKKLLLI